MKKFQIKVNVTSN